METKRYVYIEVDENDGDYVGKETPIQNKEDEDILRERGREIKEFKPYQVNRGSWIETFTNNFPWGEAWRPECGEKSLRELYKIIEQKFVDDDDLCEFKYRYFPYCEYGFHIVREFKIYEKFNEEVLV